MPRATKALARWELGEKLAFRHARTHEGLLIPRLEIQRQIPLLQSPLPLHPTETFSMLVSVPGGPVASQCQGNGTPEANLTVFQQFSRTQKI